MKKRLAYLLYLLLLGAIFIPTVFEGWQRYHFLNGSDYYQTDPQAGFFHRPNYSLTYPWPEHPAGQITIHTNNLGFKQDSATPLLPPAGTNRILFTGDSHTDGVVDNRQSLVSIFQDSLQALAGNTRFECLNGGCGFYSFQQYAGLLEKFLPLRPKEFYIIVYSGNDFLETRFYDAHWYTYPLNLQNFLYRFKKKKQLGESQNYLAQSFAQTLYANLYPASQPDMVDRAVKYLDRIQKNCAQNQIRLTVVLLPNLLDYDSSLQRLAREKMQLDSNQVQVNRRLSLQLGARMDKMGIHWLDLEGAFAASPENLFWKKDQHLNIAGHQLVARELLGDYIRTHPQR